MSIQKLILVGYKKFILNFVKAIVGFIMEKRSQREY